MWIWCEHAVLGSIVIGWALQRVSHHKGKPNRLDALAIGQSVQIGLLIMILAVMLSIAGPLTHAAFAISEILRER